MNYTNIAKLIPTMQAAALAGENLKGIPKRDGSGGGRRLNKGRGGCEITEPVGKGNGIKQTMELGATNIAGLSLIKATAQSL